MRRSKEFLDGMAAGLIWLSEILDTHSDALSRKRILNRNDIRFVNAVIDAALRRREVIADVGPKKMNLFIGKDRTVELKEK